MGLKGRTVTALEEKNASGFTWHVWQLRQAKILTNSVSNREKQNQPPLSRTQFENKLSLGMALCALSLADQEPAERSLAWNRPSIVNRALMKFQHRGTPKLVDSSLVSL